MGYPWVEAADGGTLWRSACFKDRDGYDRKDFEKDMELTPEYADKLLSEVSYTMEDKRNKLYIDEAKDADYIIYNSKCYFFHYRA